MRKIDDEEVLRRFRVTHGNRYGYSRVDYQGTRENVWVHCEKHGCFEIQAEKHINGHGCPNCKRNEKKEIFILKAELFHGPWYDYGRVVYLGEGILVEIWCPIHGYFWQTPDAHKRHGCRKCSIEKNARLLRKGQDKVIEEFKSVHGDKFGYSKVVYINDSTDIIFICPKHGERRQTPFNHKRGSGCGRCAGRIECQQDFLDDVYEVHGDKYIYLEDYVGPRIKLKIQCKNCGTIFRPTPGDHLGGSGCPECAVSGFKPNKPAILYYLKHIKSGYYKSGITNRTIKERFGIRYKEFDVIQVTEFEKGTDAKDRESKILEEYSDYRITFEEFTGNGATEFFNKDILNLDDN